jgi:hypothetical protein
MINAIDRIVKFNLKKNTYLILISFKMNIEMFIIKEMI